MRLLLTALVALCLVSAVEARGPKMYYQAQPDGSITFFQKGPKVRSRLYYSAVNPNPVNPNPAPTAKPATAGPVCPHCGKPLPTAPAAASPAK